MTLRPSSSQCIGTDPVHKIFWSCTCSIWAVTLHWLDKCHRRRTVWTYQRGNQNP